MTIESTSVAGDVAGTGAAVDAWRLLRIVRVRRELKAVCLIAVVAVPVWAAFTLIAESALSRTSSTFWTIDSTIGPGFLIILSALAVAFLTILLTGLLGSAGRAAARVAPVFGRTPDVRVVGSSEPVGGLYGRLRRRAIVPASSVLLFLVFAGVATSAGASMWPAWQANHGHGGPVVTVGTTATVASSSVGSHGHRNYFLSTPYGPAIAEDYRPSDGQRWTVLPSNIGNGKAYLVGGHDYVLLVAIVSMCVLGCAGTAWYAARLARVELRARAAISGTLAQAVEYLSGGHTAELQIFKRQLSRGSTSSFQPRKFTTATLSMRPVGSRGVHAWLARRRRMAWVTTVVLVAAAGTVVGLWRAGVLRVPPNQRDMTLAFLSTTKWDPDVTVYYTDLGSATQVLHDALSDAGTAGGGSAVTASVIISVRDPGSDEAAFVDIASLGSVPPGTAVSGMIAMKREVAESRQDAVSAISGAPAGWQGVTTTNKTNDTSEVDLVEASGNQLLWVTLNGRYAEASILAEDGAALAQSISGWGASRFAGAVAR